MKSMALFMALLLALVPACALAEPEAQPTEAAPAAATAAPTEAAAEYRELERGDEGEDVQALMQRLADLGYYTSDVDDIFGQGMARAVLLFNAQHGLGNSETASVQTQQIALSQDAQARAPQPPVIRSVALEQYEGKPVFSVEVYNPQEADITFLSVIYRCYDASGNEITAMGADPSAIGSEPKFAKYSGIAIGCGESVNLRDVSAFDLSAYPGVSRVEASLYCYQAGSQMLVMPERYFVWVGSDGTSTGTSADQVAIALLNRTVEQDTLASRFALGAKVEYIFAYESARYGLPCGLYLVEVAEGGSCARAGLQVGDVITALAGVKLDFEEALYLVKAQMQPDIEYALEYSRGGQLSGTTLSWSESNPVDVSDGEADGVGEAEAETGETEAGVGEAEAGTGETEAGADEAEAETGETDTGADEA